MPDYSTSTWATEAEAGTVDPIVARRMYEAEQLVFRRTLPIVTRTVQGRGIGTGTLFEAEGRLFLITAGHVADECEKAESVTIPSGLASGRARTVGPVRRFSVASEGLDLDVVALLLLDEDLTRLLRSRMDVMTADDVAAVPDGTEWFYLAGYPSVYVDAVEDDVATGMAVTVASEYVSDPPQKTSPETHLLLRHSLMGKDAAGQPVQGPELGGVSGATVWAFDLSRDEQPDWTARSALRAVAVQTHYYRGRYIRSTRWRAVAEALRSIVPKTAEELIDKLQ